MRHLVELGTRFDRTAGGDLPSPGRAGTCATASHMRAATTTGAEIVRALVRAVQDDSGIVLYEQALALDLLADDTGAVRGVTLHVMGQGPARQGRRRSGARRRVGDRWAGQVFAATTNPDRCHGRRHGDGRPRRGGDVDLEFVQFHPTVMCLGPAAAASNRWCPKQCAAKGAAPRSPWAAIHAGTANWPNWRRGDVVAKAIMRVMQTGAPNVWLDGRGLGSGHLGRTIPPILARSRDLGIDPVTQLIPVTPAPALRERRVRTDLSGRASLRGLFALRRGGLHRRARREPVGVELVARGLVFAERIARFWPTGFRAVGTRCPRWAPPRSWTRPLVR